MTTHNFRWRYTEIGDSGGFWIGENPRLRNETHGPTIWLPYTVFSNQIHEQNQINLASLDGITLAVKRVRVRASDLRDAGFASSESWRNLRRRLVRAIGRDQLRELEAAEELRTKGRFVSCEFTAAIEENPAALEFLLNPQGTSVPLLHAECDAFA